MKKMFIYLNSGQIKVVTINQPLECSLTDLADACTDSGTLYTANGHHKIKNYTHFDVV